MPIEQTVEVPPSHRLLVEVPQEVPAGKAIEEKPDMYLYELAQLFTAGIRPRRAGAESRRRQNGKPFSKIGLKIVC